MREDKPCLICGCTKSHCEERQNGDVPGFHKLNRITIWCRECGHVHLYGMLGPQLEIEYRKPEEYANSCFKMACLLYERKLQGKNEPIAFYMKHEGRPEDSQYPCYEYMEWNKSFPEEPLEKIDRGLLNFMCYVGEEFEKTIITQSEIPHGNVKIIFCKDTSSANRLVKLIEEMELGIKTQRASRMAVALTALGWKRISDLRDQQAENSKTCFVAMAYNDSTDDYREAVRKAVEKAGYRADEITVDEVEHNNFIMDEVINKINEARFIIADFTTLPEEDEKESPQADEGKPQQEPKVKNGVRGGVYWEAGYARGLGKEVIHTRRADENTRRRLHFDVEQINTLFWTDADFVTFTRNLTERIKATVGKGPLRIS
jgi:hypothetical protein